MTLALLTLYSALYFGIQLFSLVAVFVSMDGIKVVSVDDAQSPDTSDASTSPLPDSGFKDEPNFTVGLMVLISNFFMASMRIVMRERIL